MRGFAPNCLWRFVRIFMFYDKHNNEIRQLYATGFQHTKHIFTLCETLEAENAALRAWKESALAVEREWDCQKIAKLLGARLGYSCRKKIMRKAPQLVEELAAWRACAVALAADLRGCSDCCDVSTCVCRASLAEFERLKKL